MPRAQQQLELFTPQQTPLTMRVMSMDGRVLDVIPVEDDDWHAAALWGYVATVSDRDRRRWVHLHHSCRAACLDYPDWTRRG